MTEATESPVLDPDDPKVVAIREFFPRIDYHVWQLRQAGFEPAAVMLPAELDPGAYDGPDATQMPAQFLGLPVVWGDRVGLVMDA